MVHVLKFYMPFLYNHTSHHKSSILYKVEIPLILIIQYRIQAIYSYVRASTGNECKGEQELDETVPIGQGTGFKPQIQIPYARTFAIKSCICRQLDIHLIKL